MTEQHKIQGVLLPPGFRPEDDMYNISELNTIRHRFNPPLSQEELECWKEHRYLQCPISQETIKDVKPGIGIGILIYPYMLSEGERKRQSDDTKSYEKKDLKNGDLFQVYPKVSSPDINLIDSEFDNKLIEKGENVKLGKISVVVGHYFSRKAYNWGSAGNKGKGIGLDPFVLPMTQRGVRCLKQQYNAHVFKWTTIKPEKSNKNSSTEKKAYSFKRKNYNITNRIAVYATPTHGKNVIPKLLESQISLILYSHNNIFQKYPDLLPSATRKVLPRILCSTIEEILSDSNEGVILDEEFMDHVIRTYCFIHQVSIKFIKNETYTSRKIYEHIYRKIIHFIQNPFSPMNRMTWPIIEEVLVAASLVNINWSVIREAIVRRLFVEFINSASNMRENAPIHERIRHIYNQNTKRIQKILAILSFHTSKPLYELDEIYERCGGLLPKSMRDKMKLGITEIKNVNSLEEFWTAIGMDNPALPKKEINKNIQSYFTYIQTHIKTWETSEVPNELLQNIKIPDIKHKYSVSSMGILNYKEKAKKMKKERRKELLKTHQGMPLLNKIGHLSYHVCGYPMCKKKYSCRSALFEHLREALPNLSWGYHYYHNGLIPKNIDSLKCEARICGKKFSNVDELKKHYAQVGIFPYFNYDRQFEEEDVKPTPEEKEFTKETEEVTKEMQSTGKMYENMNECVVCMDDTRQSIFMNCGHLVCCNNCSTQFKNCPMCRSKIVETILVSYHNGVLVSESDLKELKIFT